MNITEFYAKFNKIVSQYDTQEKTTKELNALLAEVKDEDYAASININVKDVVEALEKQKLNLAQMSQQDNEDYTDEYEPSYEDSYDYDNSY